MIRWISCALPNVYSLKKFSEIRRKLLDLSEMEKAELKSSMEECGVDLGDYE